MALFIRFLLFKGYGVYRRGGADIRSGHIKKIFQEEKNYIKSGMGDEMLKAIEEKSGKNERLFKRILKLYNSTEEEDFNIFLENSKDSEALWKDFKDNKIKTDLRGYDFVTYGKEIIAKSVRNP